MQYLESCFCGVANQGSKLSSDLAPNKPTGKDGNNNGSTECQDRIKQSIYSPVYFTKTQIQI